MTSLRESVGFAAAASPPGAIHHALDSRLSIRWPAANSAHFHERIGAVLGGSAEAQMGADTGRLQRLDAGDSMNAIEADLGVTSRTIRNHLHAAGRPLAKDRHGYDGCRNRSTMSANTSSFDFVASIRTTNSLRSKSSITGAVFAW